MPEAGQNRWLQAHLVPRARSTRGHERRPRIRVPAPLRGLRPAPREAMACWTPWSCRPVIPAGRGRRCGAAGRHRRQRRASL